ncbi:MAG: hypothetical protein H8K05_21745 [Nitrospira sp.]|nr:hypothetical protein [Nitrospira sp.]
MGECTIRESLVRRKILHDVLHEHRQLARDQAARWEGRLEGEYAGDVAIAPVRAGVFTGVG